MSVFGGLVGSLYMWIFLETSFLEKYSEKFLDRRCASLKLVLAEKKLQNLLKKALLSDFLLFLKFFSCVYFSSTRLHDLKLTII